MEVSLLCVLLEEANGLSVCLSVCPSVCTEIHVYITDARMKNTRRPTIDEQVRDDSGSTGRGHGSNGHVTSLVTY